MTRDEYDKKLKEITEKTKNGWILQSEFNVYDYVSSDWDWLHYALIMKDGTRHFAHGGCDESLNGMVSTYFEFEKDDDCKLEIEDIYAWTVIPEVPKEIK